MIERTKLSDGRGFIYMRDLFTVAEVNKMGKFFVYRVFVPNLNYILTKHEVIGFIPAMYDAVEIVDVILSKVFKGEEIVDNNGKRKKDVKREVDIVDEK